MRRALRDAAGRAVRVGDTVGGVTSPPAQLTIIGEVTEVRMSRVLVEVVTVTAPNYTWEVPAVGTPVWLLARRLFLIHGQAIQGQQVRAVAGPFTSMRWSGRGEDLMKAAEFAGEDLIAAVAGDGGDGITLVLRVSKARPEPALVPPGWFILRPPGRVRHRAVDPDHYATAYAPLAPE